jgi:hypothetical protein
MNILDTGDNYILAVENHCYKDALFLYSLLDVSINEIKTGVFVNQDTAKFIFQSIGKIIAYGFADTDANIRIDIPSKLIDDIKKTIEFSKVKSFWENVQYPPKPKVKYDEQMCYSSFSCKFADVNSNEHINTPPNKPEPKSSIYVFFNNIYNLTLVVNSQDLLSVPSDIPANFQDFSLVKEFLPSMSADTRKAFDNIFHKKSFQSVYEIEEKIKAFENLYNISNVKTEKAKVKEYFDTYYLISNEVEKRIKANDLYKEVINNLCIPYDNAALFKKRLAGYLIEFSLQKKRFSDAYYYYGLEKLQAPKITLEQIEEKS